MHPWTRPLHGRLVEIDIDSDALADNPLGDPAQRPLWVYLPPGYDDSDRRYPAIYWLHGVTGSVDKWKNRDSFRPSPIERFDALFEAGQAEPCILVFVDGWTRLGGAQWIDSPGTGRYHTYLCEDVVAFVDAGWRTLADRDHRAVAGKSSGGYGAMVNAMLRPDVFGALATHAGDSLFEACYLPHFREDARLLRDEYDGSFEDFWDDFRSHEPFAGPHDFTLLNDWCMAACYSARPDGRPHLPYDPATGRMRPEVWEEWLAWDPVRMAAQHADALRSLVGIWVDCGKRDQYYLDLGAEAFRQELEAAGVTELYFELFDATHDGIEYRYPMSVRWLLERIGA